MCVSPAEKQGFFGGNNVRILLVIDQRKDDEYYKMYSKYALREDIVSVTYQDIKSKIEIMLLQNQEHIDVIVFDVDEKIDFDIEDNILSYIRTKVNHTYSNKNFRLSYIPIVFLYKEYMVKRNGEISLSKFPYHIQYNTGIIGLYETGLAKSIDNWLSTLSDDLDKLDLNTEFNFEKTNETLNEERINDCKVLSREFFQSKRHLDYNWLGNKLNLLEEGSDKLYKILKNCEVNPKLRNEKEIHQVLEVYKGFLLEEKYKRSVYEQHLYYTYSRKYVEVDFINISHSYYNLPIELFEVKLPNHCFVSRKGILYNNTKKYIDQIGKRYKDYFDNENHHSHIKEKLQIDPIPFNLSLLIGRAKDIEENKYLLNKSLEKYSQSINIKSYDDLIDKYNFIYKRIKRFNIN